MLTTLSSLKTYLGITDTSEDAKLTQILASLDDVVERWIGRKLESTSYTEYYDGSGEELLLLRQRPVTVVTSVHVDQDGFYGKGSSPFPASDIWIEGSDFVPKRFDESEENGSLLIALKGTDFTPKGNGFWPTGRGNVKVIYTAGYLTIPKNVELAVWLLAADLRASSKKGIGGPLQSETLGRYSYTRLQGGASEVLEARNLLADYAEPDF